MKCKCLFLMALLLVSLNSFGFEQFEDDDFKIMTSIASGRAVEKEKAAAIVTILTKEDIEKIGALTIEEALETVPGLHVEKDTYVRSNKYVFRGLGTRFNPEALLLFNGTPITSVSSGNRTQAGFGGMAVNNIERIEVIRGPGSALYGADAYAGVINIITKKSMDYTAVAKARVGSFDTMATSLQTSGTYDGLSYYLSFDAMETEGNDSVVDYDGQSELDKMFPTNASLAPTSPNFNNEAYDGSLNINYKDLINFNYIVQYRNDMGIGFGLNDVIIKDSKFDNNRHIVALNYTPTITNFNFDFKLSYYQMEEYVESPFKLYPDGAFGGVFPDGVVGSPERDESTIRTDNKILYSGFNNHFVQTGFGFVNSRVYNTREKKNFSDNMMPRPEGVVDVSNSPNEVFLEPQSRQNFYLFIQDEWLIDNDWTLTTGLRYDYYNDFGSTVNPRVALVWNTSQKMTSKFLYGRAFRAPSISEIHVKSNPFSLGNEDLEAETIDTYEVSFNYQWHIDTNISWNMFFYETKNYIALTALEAGTYQFDNAGEASGYGSEIELTHEFNDHIKITGNYSYQQNKNDVTNNSTAIHPAHMLYTRLSADYQKWSVNLQSNWVGKRNRANDDFRSNLSGYNKIDLNITRKNIFDINKMDVKLYVKNLMDEDVREPSTLGGIKNDYPMPGRNAYLEINYSF